MIQFQKYYELTVSTKEEQYWSTGSDDILKPFTTYGIMVLHIYLIVYSYICYYVCNILSIGIYYSSICKCLTPHIFSLYVNVTRFIYTWAKTLTYETATNNLSTL